MVCLMYKKFYLNDMDSYLRGQHQDNNVQKASPRPAFQALLAPPR